MYSKIIDNKKDMLSALEENGMNLSLASIWLEIDKEMLLAAVKNNPHAMQFAQDELKNDEEILSYVDKNFEYYWHVINPSTRRRFDIPMLSFKDNDYKMKYIDYMKLREKDEAGFARILNWN